MPAHCRRRSGNADKTSFFVADDCHPQTIAVIATRARAVGVKLVIGPVSSLAKDAAGFKSLFGLLVQYPTTEGRIVDYADVVASAHASGTLVVFATDLLALTLMTPPGEFDADIAVGSSQRFGVPMGFGGPHAAFMSTQRDHARKMPGRIVGVSRDAQGKPALRLAIQTREQHIRREKATSNICTAQVLLAVMAGMYAVYHGPQGLKQIASRIQLLCEALCQGLGRLGHSVSGPAFDTIVVDVSRSGAYGVIEQAARLGFNLRDFPGQPKRIGISLDETATRGRRGIPPRRVQRRQSDGLPSL